MFWHKKQNTAMEAKLPGEKRRDGFIETDSPTWGYIEKWAQETLTESRQHNDGEYLDPTKTALLRGRIAILKQILDLPKQGLLR